MGERIVIRDEKDGTYWAGGGDFSDEAADAVTFPDENSAQITIALLTDVLEADMGFKLITAKA